MKRLLSFGVIVASAIIAACGGSGNTITDPGGGSGGGDVGEVTVEMGRGTPPNFFPQQIAVAVPSLAAGGSTSLTVTFVTSLGSLYAEPVDVTFSSPCLASGLANINGSDQGPITSNTGILTVTYGATGCSGADNISATAVVGGTVLSAVGLVTVAPASVGSIEFLSAQPQKIGLKGTGGAGIPETSTVTFKVVDSTGGPVAGAEVNFSLDTTVGGITWSPQTGAISGADGRVQTVVTSGTVATTVRVTATIVATNISTQSSQLTVTTGLPDQDSTSLAVSCFNVEGLTIDGTQADVTVRLSDRFNNPVPDGTAVTLNTEGGNIVGSCVTGTTATESGVCGVKWTSANPRPADGRSTLIATAIGEESFTDLNSNGIYDSGEPWGDLAEPFRDDNEDGIRDPNEIFFDFNNDNVYTPADGLFSGLLCNAGANCGTSTIGISASSLIVMSGSTAVISDDAGGTLTGSGAITFYVRDVNNQPMPAGTTISATTSNGKIIGPTEYTVPCTTSDDPADLQYTFNIEGNVTPPVAGILTLTVESPSGVQTVYFVTIND